jgi:hypothetical protein
LLGLNVYRRVLFRISKLDVYEQNDLRKYRDPIDGTLTFLGQLLIFYLPLAVNSLLIVHMLFNQFSRLFCESLQLVNQVGPVASEEIMIRLLSDLLVLIAQPIGGLNSQLECTFSYPATASD